MTEERPKLTRTISTLRLSTLLAPVANQVDTPDETGPEDPKYRCPHGSDIPLEADFAVTVVMSTNEAIAAIDKHLVKMSEHVHDMGVNGVPLKLSKDVYDCLKKRLDTKLNNFYGIARTAAKRCHAD